jgi:hypothetical protein
MEICRRAGKKRDVNKGVQSFFKTGGMLEYFTREWVFRGITRMG